MHILSTYNQQSLISTSCITSGFDYSHNIINNSVMSVSTVTIISIRNKKNPQQQQYTDSTMFQAITLVIILLPAQVDLQVFNKD